MPCAIRKVYRSYAMANLTAPQTGKQNDTENGGIRVIARAADILTALGKHQDGMTLGEIAQQVGLPRSTVQRIVKALDDANFLIAASPTSGVRLGPAFLALAASAKQFSIAELARPVVLQLSRDTGETVDIAILGSDKAVVVDQIHGTHPLLAVSAVGNSLPLHCSATGKAILAALPSERLAQLKKRISLHARTPNSITSWDRLERELAVVRRRGIAFDREEYFLGICAVGVAISGPGDEIAAISIPVPTERFNENEKRLTEALLDRTRALQRRI